MEFSGEQVINAPQERVYDALTDPVILREIVPGCRAMVPGDDGRSDVSLVVRIGPEEPHVRLTVELFDENRPAGYALGARADAGEAGSARATAHVALAPVDAATTNLAYQAAISVDGRLAALGTDVLRAALRSLSAEFLARLAASLADDEPPATPPPAAKAVAEGEAGREDGPDSGEAAAAQTPGEPVADGPAPGPPQRDTPGTAAVIAPAPPAAPAGRTAADAVEAVEAVEAGEAGPDAAEAGEDAVAERHAVRPSASGLPESTRRVGLTPLEAPRFEEARQDAPPQEEAREGRGFQIRRLILVALGLVLIALLLADGF